MQTKLGDGVSALIGMLVGAIGVLLMLFIANWAAKTAPAKPAATTQLWETPGHNVYRFPQSNLRELAEAVAMFRSAYPEFDSQTPAVVMPGPAGSYGAYGCILIFAKPEPPPERKKP